MEIKRVNEEKDNLVAAEQARFSDLQKLHDETKTKHLSVVQRKEDNHIKVRAGAGESVTSST